MLEELDLGVVEQEELLGAADIVSELEVEQDEEAIGELQARIREQGVGLPGARASLFEDVRRILNRLRGRELVEDLGVHNVRVEWLSFHVPPGGTAGLKFERSAEHSSGVKLKFIGLGFGSGRSVSITAEHDFGDRNHCFNIGSTLAVRLRTYANDGGDEADLLQVDVENMVGFFLNSLAACPLCFTDPERGPRRAQSTGREWDLSNDAQGLTETQTFEFGEERELEVGLEIPVVTGLPAFNPAVAMSRSMTNRCIAKYQFPGKARFTAYQLVGKGQDFPFWGRY